MEKLIQLAKSSCDKAEVYSYEYQDNLVSFENARLKDIDTKFQSGFSLRIIGEDKLGFAYTRNLINREGILKNALDSQKGGVEAAYDFPQTKGIPQLDTCDSSLEDLSTSRLVEECSRVCDILKSKTDAEIKMGCLARIENIRIINTQGNDNSMKSSKYFIYGNMIYPGSGLGIYRIHQSKSFDPVPDELTDEMVELYNLSSKVVEPKGGKMKVAFMPNSMVTFNWRFSSGASSKSVYEKISPISGKIGEKIFDEKISIYDDPLDDEFLGARAFDDEGVECKNLTLVEKGILKNFFYDLDYAKKLKAKSTGHGYRTELWGGDPVTLKPIPALFHLYIKPGDKSFSDLVKSMDRGIMVEAGLGFHSGNIPNGDFSIGACPGLYVEKGEIVGRVKDAMVAGNIYQVFKNVVDVGDTLYPSFWGGRWPVVLCEGVSVATKA